MRKIIALFACITLYCSISKAQYVNIPDTNFRNYLQLRFPGCFNGSGQMDTTCSEIVNLEGLSIYAYNNLDGFQYFKNLISLSIQGDGDVVDTSRPVPVIPALPASLKYLSMYGNFQDLNSLPAGLK